MEKQRNNFGIVGKNALVGALYRNAPTVILVENSETKK